MSKSISGGLGTVNLTVGELRLLGATFDNFNSTNGTITGTCIINNLVITGTFSITDLEIANEFTAPIINTNTLNVTGTITTQGDIIANEDVDITGDLYLQNLDTTDVSTFYDILIKGANNKIIRDDQLKFNTGSNTLLTINVECSTIKINAAPQLNSDNNFRLIPFIGVDNILHTDTKLSFNPNSNTLDTGIINCLTINVDDINITNDLSITGSTNLGNNVSVNALNGVEINTVYRILLWDNTNTFGRPICADFTNLYYDTTANTIYVPRISLTSLPQDNADNNFRLIPFLGVNNVLHTDTKLSFNPNSNTLDTSIINCLTLNVDDIIISNETTIHRGIATADLDFNILFINSSDNVRISQATYPLTFNPADGFLKCKSIELTEDITIPGDTIITAYTSTNDFNSRVLFLDSNASATGVISNNGGFYYNANSGTLVAPTFRGTTAVTTPLINVLGTTDNGTINVDNNNNYGMMFNHTYGYVFRMSGVWKIRVASSATTIYNDLGCQQDVTINGDITKATKTLSAANRNMNLLFHDFHTYDKRIKEQDLLYYNPSSEKLFVQNIQLTESNPGVAQIQNVISFDNVGFIRGQRSSTLDPQLSMRNNSANTGFQIQLNPTTTYFNAPPSGLHRFYIDNGSSLDVKLEINTNTTIINNGVELNDVNDFTGASNKILLRNTFNKVVKSVNTSVGIGLGGVEYISTEEVVASDSIRLKGLALNYTEIYENATWTTNTGSFGQGRLLQINNTITPGKLVQYGDIGNPTGGIFQWKTGLQKSEFQFTDSAYNGTYELMVTALYQNNLTGNSDRVVPKIEVGRYVTTATYELMTHFHEFTPYIRYSQGKIASFGVKGTIRLEANKPIRLYTYLNIAGATNFSSTTTSFTGTDFRISVRYLGNLTETTS